MKTECYVTTYLTDQVVQRLQTRVHEFSTLNLIAWTGKGTNEAISPLNKGAKVVIVSSRTSNVHSAFRA